jgi:hypothetical protein
MTVEKLSGSLQRIALVKKLPKDLDVYQLENVRNSALNLCAVIIEYLALAIKQLISSTPRISLLRVLIDQGIC